MSNTPLGTRKLRLTIDGEEYTADVSKCRITSGPASSDFISFRDAANGGAREYKLKFTATQDPADQYSIWSQIWNNAGGEAEVEVLPYGGEEVSVTNPAFQGVVEIAEPDGDLLGGDANASTTAKFTIDLEWTFKAKPAKVTAA